MDTQNDGLETGNSLLNMASCWYLCLISGVYLIRSKNRFDTRQFHFQRVDWDQPTARGLKNGGPGLSRCISYRYTPEV